MTITKEHPAPYVVCSASTLSEQRRAQISEREIIGESGFERNPLATMLFKHARPLPSHKKGALARPFSGLAGCVAAGFPATRISFSR